MLRLRYRTIVLCLINKCEATRSFTTTSFRWANDESGFSTGSTPLMKAVIDGDVNSIKQQLEADAASGRIQLSWKDEQGRTVFHHIAASKNNNVLKLFHNLDQRFFGDSLDAVNREGKTAFQVAVDKKNLAGAMELLVAGANANKALQVAVDADNVDLVKMALAFGADVGLANSQNGLSKTLQQSRKPNRDEIAEVIHRAGAFDATAGAAAASSDNINLINQHFKELVTDDSKFSRSVNGHRVLCLDGGGIRGLVLIRLLQALENATGKPIKRCFDWISGTSTGGILALAILRGKSLRYCLSSYLSLKDVVFNGSPPYDPAPLEKFLVEVFGETTVMSQFPALPYDADAANPHVLVTSVMADRWPTELHLFRNYDGPSVTVVKDESDGLWWSNQLMWKAARASSAAPFFFPEFEERFLDGGLVANNPTLDTLTEIQQLNKSLQHKNMTTNPVKIVLSLGTGHNKTEAFSGSNVFRWRYPGDILKIAIGAYDIIKIMADQALEPNGRVVERAAAWCSSLNLPYVRLNPELSEHIKLNCADTKKLLNLMLDTQLYINSNKQLIADLAKLL